MSKTMKECLQVIGIESNDERIVDRITNDSRDCTSNSVFIGHKYIEDALNKRAMIIDSKYTSQLFNYFYDNPSNSYFVIGVTGTNAKTSITILLKEMLTSLGYRCIRLGTNYHEFDGKIEESSNTTMDLMYNLNVFLKYKNKVDIIIMEVSTHAIEENRISFIRFDRIIYTNLSKEHLDYHKTFTHYKNSKFKLRNYLKKDGKILLNMDDPYLHELLNYTRETIITYGKNARFQIKNIQSNLFETTFMIKNIIFKTNLCGEYVGINCCAALCLLDSMNIPLGKCVSIIQSLKMIEGRMEIIKIKERIIVIDYAHTPAALEAACIFLNKNKINRFICVFGCGGERDKEKREVMAKVASNNSDLVIICEDNNRNESFLSIIKDMKLERFHNVIVIEKRENACTCAFHTSQMHDIILVAGKGNEQFLVASGVKTPYNDKTFMKSLER